MARVRLLRDGQVTLPAAFRQKLKLAEGDYLDAELVEDGVLLRPVSATSGSGRGSGPRCADIGSLQRRRAAPRARRRKRSGWRRRSRPLGSKSMPSVVADTTVLISGFITPAGVAAQLLEAARQAGFDHLSSREIIEELRTRLLHRRRIRNALPLFRRAGAPVLPRSRGRRHLVVDLPPFAVVVAGPRRRHGHRLRARRAERTTS